MSVDEEGDVVEIDENVEAPPPERDMKQEEDARSQKIEFPNETVDSCTATQAVRSSNWRIVPEGSGLCIQFNWQRNGSATSSIPGDGELTLTFERNAALKHIHPNVNVPAYLEDVRALGGGGSGVTVMRGRGSELSAQSRDAGLPDVVLKHGGDKDTSELLGLAIVGQQLRLRGEASAAAAAAAADMLPRLSKFRFIYIHSSHLRERGMELWNKFKHACKASGMHLPTPKARCRHRQIRVCASGFCMKQPAGLRNGDQPAHQPGVRLLDTHFDVCPSAEGGKEGEIDANRPPEGFDTFERFVRELIALQRQYVWKFTLAQEAIGGPESRTASSWLQAGLLQGGLLDTLLEQMLRVIQDLQTLTSPQEEAGADDVRREVAELMSREDATPAHVSALADRFVGFNIKKNYDLNSGRFKVMRELGAKFREGSLYLSDSEREPARYLGEVLREGALMEDIFFDGPSGQCALDLYEHTWRDVLSEAVNLRGRHALARIWNGGLTDAGLHNMFLDEYTILLFDLGEPTLPSLPAFLTKFLMSFFHALGMEEEMQGGDWVNRFSPNDENSRLLLTPRTAEVLGPARESFRRTLEFLIDRVFEGEREVCGVLVKYTVLQLLSDAAFCLGRWVVKGGGMERAEGYAPRLEKWLWRALWDIYAASAVASEDWLTRTQ